VPVVATRAVLVFGLGVEAGQCDEGVTSRARGWSRDAARPVRAMTAETPDCDLTMRGLGFCRVTTGALHLLARSGMWLMTADAGLMSNWRAGRLALMTILAWRSYGAAVWLVTADAVLVSDCDRSTCLGVAARADGLTGAGIVRQSVMATLAGCVTATRGDLDELLLVTALTARVLRKRDLEVVRRMTA
jgi:hypothetical protein